MLSVKNVSFHYGSRSVLSNISFEIQPESINVLLGPNGSGKTTLLRCLDLYLNPQQGEIRLNGTPITEYSPNALARKIACMPQRCGISGLTVFDSILLGRKPYLSWRPEPRDYQLVEKTMERLNLWDKALRTLDQLSGGELQKVSLGRIFVQEPELILLDEPLNALDLKNRMEIMRHLSHFVRHYHSSVLMSIHELSDAFRIADRFLILKDGVLRADVTPESITGEMLSEIYDLPLEIYSHSQFKLVVPKGE